MRLTLLTLSALMIILLALSACQTAGGLETLEPTLEAALTEDLGPTATEEAPTPDPTPLPPTPVPAAAPVSEPENGMTSFASSDESLSFVYPDGWSVEETGPGRVILANSDGAMSRFDNGALQSGDVRISITLVPANMLADYGLHMGNTAEEALQFIPDSGIFVTEQEDPQVGEIQSIELENTASAAQLSIVTSDQEGVLIAEMHSDQVVAFISAVAPMGEYANFEESVRNIVDSISVSVTADEMMALIMSSVQG
jgi:glucose/arabinose dehydrogenase